MKKSIFLSAMLFIAITVFTKCKKDGAVPPPSADFTYSGAGLAPAAVTFINSSVNATSYFWDFGDGNNSILQNPSHTYTKGGVFTVTLTAYSGNALNTFTQAVIITSPTKATITKVELGSLASMPSGNFQAYLVITVDQVNSLWSAGNYNLTASMLPIDLLINSPYTITNFNQLYYLEVGETGTNALLGYVDIDLGLYTTGISAYPTSITIPSSITGTGMILYLKWE